MRTLEDLMVKEFRDATKNPRKVIDEVPLPSCVSGWSRKQEERYLVRGIENNLYSALNNEVVYRIPKSTTPRRREIDKVTRSFKKDENGNFIYKDYQIPSGSMAVVSTVQLGLPYSEYIQPTKGYGYIDFVSSKTTTGYIYVIPKEYLYPLRLTALVVTYASNVKCYSGRGFQSWRNGLVYLKVIPYKPYAVYKDTRILCIGYGLNYNSQIKEILNHWLKINFIPDIRSFILEDGTNLVIKGISSLDESYLPVSQVPVDYKETFGGNE